MCVIGHVLKDIQIQTMINMMLARGLRCLVLTKINVSCY